MPPFKVLKMCLFKRYITTSSLLATIFPSCYHFFQDQLYVFPVHSFPQSCSIFVLYHAPRFLLSLMLIVSLHSVKKILFSRGESKRLEKRRRKKFFGFEIHPNQQPSIFWRSGKKGRRARWNKLDLEGNGEDNKCKDQQ